MPNPPPDPLFTLREHSGEVTSLCFVDSSSSYFPWLLSGSSTGELFLWNLETYRVCQSLKGHERKHIIWVKSIDNLLLSQGRDGTVQLWKTDGIQWKSYGSVSVPAIGFCQCDVSKERSILATPSDSSSETKLVDLETRHVLSTLVPSSAESVGMIMCMKWISLATDNPLLLCGYENGQIMLWDPREAKQISNLTCHSEPVFSLDFDINLRKGITSSAEQDLKIFSLSTSNSLEEKHNINLPSLGASSVAIRHDGKIVASGGWDGVVRIYSWKTLKPLAYLNFHKATVNSLNFYSGESGKYAKLLAAGSKDKRITLWSIYSNK